MSITNTPSFSDFLTTNLKHQEEQSVHEILGLSFEFKKELIHLVELIFTTFWPKKD